MADNRLIYQLTDGTPASTDVVPYSGPASGDAFKATVQELWAAGSNPQVNANVGTGNVITTGPSTTAAEGYTMGNDNLLAGCCFAFGDNNSACGTIEPCSMSYGKDNESYAGGFSFGQSNYTAGTVGVPVTGASSYTVGRALICTGTNNVCEGYNSSIGFTQPATLIGSNTYSVGAGNYTQYFTTGRLTLVYNNSLGTKTSEILAYNNVQFTGGITTFELASLSMTPSATPDYRIFTHDCSQSFSYGYGNQTQLSDTTTVIGRNNLVQNGSNNTFLGNGFYEILPTASMVYIGGDCNLNLKGSKIVYTTGMTANPPPAYTTSWTVDGSGNVNVQSASLIGNLITINQTSDITVNAIINFSTISAPVEGQTFRLVNIGTNTITLSKDNATGQSGKRLIWQKTGNNLNIATNHSVQFIYLSTLPLSGSTGGWLVIPDGIG